MTRLRSTACKAGIALVAMSVSACVSSSDLDGLTSGIKDVQLQLLQLQKQTPTHDDVAAQSALREESLESLVRSQTDLSTDVQELASAVEQLQAKLDDTTFRLTQLTQQIAATSQEIKAIRSATEQVPRQSISAPPPRGQNTSDHQDLYDTAYNDYVAGNLDLAILGFRSYLERHPETPLTDNAIYWLGECYYHLGQFQRAIAQFDRVLEGFPQSDRQASTRVKKAYALLELGQRDEGIDQLRRVVCGFDGTDEALLASQRLVDLGFDVDC